MESILKLFSLAPEDRRVLYLLGPLFFVVTASNVVVASFTKALFLSANEVSAMPWMFLGSSLFTAGASVLYVMAMERLSLRPRFQTLLATAVVSFAALRLLYPLAERAMSLTVYVWCTGIGHLVLIQMWNLSSGLLPARQAKRLFPVFAAIATAGAAAGGGMVQLVLGLDLPAHDLVWLVVALLLLPLARVGSVVREFDGAMPPSVAEVEAGRRRGPVRSDSEMVRGVRNIMESPLLVRLALFVFLMQIGSVALDYQFSSALKSRLQRDEIAGFLGRYYGASNLIALAVALFASARLVQVVGIGFSIAMSGIFVALGSGLYLLAGLGALGDAASLGFWIVVAASFLERVANFALSRNAMQMLVTPIETRRGERAKTLIDGVVYRGATLLVSVVLLVLCPSADQLIWLSPVAMLAAVAVVIVAVRLGPHYQRTLFEALAARRLDPNADPLLHDQVQRTAVREVEARLSSHDIDVVRRALEMIRDLRLPISPTALEACCRLPDLDVARRALEILNTVGHKVSRDVAVDHLRFDSDPSLLREVLSALEPHQDPSLIDRMRVYASHDDPGVASLAVVWLKRVAGYKSTMNIHMDLMSDIESSDPEKRARAAVVAGRTGIRQATANLPKMILDPSLQVRLNAVEAMGQVGLPEYLDALVDALGRGDLADRARAALLRYGDALVPEVATRLESGALSVATQIRLLAVVEGLGGRAAAELLMGAAMVQRMPLRNQALLSLWRIARDPEKPKPPTSWLRSRVGAEIEVLGIYDKVRAALRADDVRRTFFLGELDAMRAQAETRVFRLLGLLISRAAMYRAYLHYRSPSRRARSNAIELLDQHLREPELRPFIHLVEHAFDDSGQVTVPVRTLDAADAKVAALLSDHTPWLRRVWQWAVTDNERLTLSDDGVVDVTTDPMDVVFLLKSVPLFAGLSGEQLLPVADIVQRVDFDKGEVVFEQGQLGNHVYLVLEGEVDVLHDGECVAVLGKKECFGEMALLDSGPRSASIRTRSYVSLWAIAREDFQDLLDLHPALGKGVIRVLTQRLRDATDQQANQGSVEKR